MNRYIVSVVLCKNGWRNIDIIHTVCKVVAETRQQAIDKETTRLLQLHDKYKIGNVFAENEKEM